MPRLGLMLIAASLMTTLMASAPLRAHADSVPPLRPEQMPATPAPKKDVPGSGATQAQCRDGTFSDAISGENPCRDHGGVATSLEKPDSSSGGSRP